MIGIMVIKTELKLEFQKWFLYIILSSDELLYTGITIDIGRRWQEHSGHLKSGAKFFRGRKPKELLHIEVFKDRSGASKREYAIKKLSRESKLLLIMSEVNRVTEFKLEYKLELKTE